MGFGITAAIVFIAAFTVFILVLMAFAVVMIRLANDRPKR